MKLALVNPSPFFVFCCVWRPAPENNLSSRLHLHASDFCRFGVELAAGVNVILMSPVYFISGPLYKIRNKGVSEWLYRQRLGRVRALPQPDRLAQRRARRLQHPGEKDAKLAQKLANFSRL